MNIDVTEKKHEVVTRDVAPANEVTVCCEGFAQEYGKQFMLVADGGLVPAGLRLQKTRLGKMVLVNPRAGWKFCPLCGVRINMIVKPAADVIVKPGTQSGEPAGK